MAKSKLPGQIYQIKAVLRDSAPPIWRRILARGETPLDLLHVILQIVMEWEDGHLHAFTINGEHYSSGEAMDDLGHFDETKVTLEELAPDRKTKIRYEYDFGDSWELILTVEKILSPEPRQKYPVCVDGDGAPPLDDCGGIWIWQEYLNSKDRKSNPNFDFIREILGPKGPRPFSKIRANKRFRELVE